MFKDFLRFDRYLTPSIIRLFYLLQVVLIVLVALSSIIGAFAMMSYSVMAGLTYLLATLIGAAAGLIAARIVTEIVMVLFQNNEHLAAIRAGIEGHQPAP